MSSRDWTDSAQTGVTAGGALGGAAFLGIANISAFPMAKVFEWVGLKLRPSAWVIVLLYLIPFLYLWWGLSRYNDAFGRALLLWAVFAIPLSPIGIIIYYIGRYAKIKDENERRTAEDVVASEEAAIEQLERYEGELKELAQEEIKMRRDAIRHAKEGDPEMARLLVGAANFQKTKREVLEKSEQRLKQKKSTP